jgi:hypothetical protein
MTPECAGCDISQIIHVGTAALGCPAGAASQPLFFVINEKKGRLGATILAPKVTGAFGSKNPHPTKNG